MRYLGCLFLAVLLSAAGCSGELGVEETPIDPAAEAPVAEGAGSTSENP
ncbi:hypothetical protein Poly24_22790 [Rosistilla carotiformis]|uniref:Uncharacterized protein n=1 Tax=Rosistilla carotiformis TaxID=2528017 RepID=A0A518JSQ1_9BACT|nr:hypothetical protein [Rosistilla carotiformis]QDV68569.1 hypothetical protein Poly24_22790 [Rosistilla carotiformis]